MIEPQVDKHLWSETYDGDLRDTLTVQNKVARAIAEQIRLWSDSTPASSCDRGLIRSEPIRTFRT